MTTIIASVIALFVGIAIGWFIMRLAMKYRAQNIIKEAEAEAEVIKKDKILQAKEKFLQIKAEHEKQAAARNPANHRLLFFSSILIPRHHFFPIVCTAPLTHHAPVSSTV